MSEATELIPTHDSRGKFAPGNQCGKGHGKHKGEIVALRDAFLAVITPDQMVEVTRRHLELIQSRNEKTAVAAISLLYDRLFGRPKETVDLTTTTTTSQQPPAVNLDALTDDERAAFLALAERTLSPTRTIDVTPLPPSS